MPDNNPRPFPDDLPLCSEMRFYIDHALTPALRLDLFQEPDTGTRYSVSPALASPDRALHRD